MPVQGRPGEADAQADVFLQGPPPAVEGAPKELTHAGVSFDPSNRHRFLGADLCLGGDVADGRLDDGFFPERGQDLRDVPQERSARPEHQDALPTQLGMVVEQEGGPVQPDRGLPGTGSSLHRQQLPQGRPDDLVLLGLNGGDDVEHLAGASPLELGQQGVAATQPGGAGHVAGVAEEVVGHGHDRATIDHDLATAGQSQSVFGAGSVEGNGYRGPPVDDDGVRTDVLDMATTDAPGGPVLLVDAPEEQRSWAVRQQGDPPRQRGDVVQVRAAGGNQVLQKPLGSLPHRPQRSQRMIEGGLLGGHLGVGRGSGRAHDGPFSAKTRAKAPAQKSPDIPGTVHDLDLSNKPFSWYFAFSSAWTLNL